MLFQNMTKTRAMEENNNFDAFYPFFIIIFLFIVNFFRNRAKQKQEMEQRRGRVPSPPKPFPKTAPPPSPQIATYKKNKKLEKVEEIAITKKHAKKSKHPRVVNLVSGLKSKKELVLLSEILFKKYDA
jgi:hypothetical protein